MPKFWYWTGTNYPWTPSNSEALPYVPSPGPIHSYLNLKLWSPEFSESVDRWSIHQLAATCKTNKKTMVMFRRPSDGKVSLFLEDLELRVAVSRLKILYLVLCDLLLFYGRRKEDPSFLESRRFLPIM